MLHEFRLEVVNQRMTGTTAYWKIYITRSRKRKVTLYILTDVDFLSNHRIEIYILHRVEKELVSVFSAFILQICVKFCVIRVPETLLDNIINA
jgi:hypothetical protein